MSSIAQAPHSEAMLMGSIHRLADAGGSVIQIRTREVLRAALILRKNLVGSGEPYKEWDITNGFRVFTTENFADHKVTGDGKDFLEALRAPLEDLRGPTSQVSLRRDKVHYFIYINPMPFLVGMPIVTEMLQQYSAILPSTNVCTILVTPDVPITELAVGTVVVADLPTPDSEELRAILSRSIKDMTKNKSTFPKGSTVTEEQLIKIANMGLGLSLQEFETYVAISVIDASLAQDDAITADRLLEGVARGKTAIVRQSEILELTHTEDIENVGGMGRLKDWLRLRATCFTDEAREYGIQPPKGIVLAGVPGTGKSLVAKAAAFELEIPLVRLDFGRVFSKWLGDSESRVRQALKMIEGMAPVVLFVDEIDKGLGGAGAGGGDAGSSSRVLGTFLTWLQENTAPVFTIVTANRIDSLPPELLRRGRFDEIFASGLPDAIDRRDVLAIHLRKRKRDIKKFKSAEIAEFMAVTEGYVPAEIESAVKSALIDSYNDEDAQDLEMRHIVKAIREMVPMSKSHKENIDRILKWAKDNATPVSYEPAAAGSPGGATPRTRRILTPSRG